MVLSDGEALQYEVLDCARIVDVAKDAERPTWPERRGVAAKIDKCAAECEVLDCTQDLLKKTSQAWSSED